MYGGRSMASDHDVASGIDEAVAQLRADLGDEIALELVGLFLTNTPELFTAMRAGLTASDARAVGRAAHELKSTSATLGALALRDRCAEIETLATSKAPASELSGPVDQAEASYVTTRGVLERVAASLRG